MSAHSRPFNSVCDENGCYRRAIELVFNTYNSPQGQFCKKHAVIRIKELRAGEQKQ